MNGLGQPFSQNSIAWLTISSVVALISGFLSSWLYYHFIKRKEVIDGVLAEIEKQRHQSALELEESKKERIRAEIVRWANPILSAVDELQFRLLYILKKGVFRALNKDSDLDPNWSITYSYYMNSTLYLFGQYFAWTQMLQKELNFELFQSQQEKDEFFNAINKVSESLGHYSVSHPCSGKDTQVFRLQQRAIGELMIDRENNQMQCMSYPDFLKKLNDNEFSQHMDPIKLLLDDLNPDQDCRWKRLEVVFYAIKELKECCEKILELK